MTTMEDRSHSAKFKRNLFVNLKYLRFRLSLSVIGLMVIPRLSPNCHSTDHTQTQAEPEHSESTFITTRKRSLRRLCFHRCLSVHGGSAPLHAGIHTTLSRPPPQADTPTWADTPSRLRSAWWDAVNKRAVRILLECILVSVYIYGMKINGFYHI